MSLGGIPAQGGTTLRPPIADSWRRSRLFGVEPGLGPGAISIGAVDRTSRLMTAARPVLEQLAEQLAGTRFSILLVDRDCRLVFRWFGDRGLQRQLEEIGVLEGSQLSEGRVGTNALGTPHESRQAVEIHGQEHYAEALKRFSCYGHPIRHPLTGRIEGVLDITGESSSGNPLFGPLVKRVVGDIEQLVLESARACERRLFLAFQQATHHRSVPVAVLGGDLVFANETCIEQLRPADPTLLRTLLPQVPERGVFDTRLDVGDGVSLSVVAERVEGSTDGAVFRIAKAGPSSRKHVPAAAKPARSILVAGEPGTGRTTEARRLAGVDDPVVLHAAAALREEPRAWAARFADLIARPRTTVVLDDVHLLPESLLPLVGEALDNDSPARLLLTSVPANAMPPAVAAVAIRCAETVTLAPLRERLDDLPELAAAMLRDEYPDRKPHFTGTALAALRTHPWPGNLHELRAVLREVSRLPYTGVIDLAQLPPAYRGSSRTRRLGGRELAERNAIVTALRASEGNKLRAARELGISRTTLYRRMQALGVTDDCPLL
ncbi:sigma-54-dependent Fis family transcriptional regulator [Amycolatopsis jejuensis]|uniref:sigma-54-dependent Fis family transcriptional regulator n=1 Tax=Amycolatopsis jejuensis TaxID=330084 RepID=UPI00068D4474|nr:helix-turn-helix domain-containing protein [Amycolatopsis jejuensis]